MAFRINVDKYSYSNAPDKNSQNYAAELAKKLSKEEAEIREQADKALRELIEKGLSQEAALRHEATVALNNTITAERAMREASLDALAMQIEEEAATRAADDEALANSKADINHAHTAEEVGALPDTTEIPSKVSQLENDSGYLTDNIPICNGDGEGSVVLNDRDTNKAISVNSSVFGVNNTAGTNAFTITATADLNDGTGTYTLDSVEGLEVGMRYSVAIYHYLANQGEILDIYADTNTVKVSDFDYWQLSSGFDKPQQHKYYNKFIVVDHPELGTTNIGANAVSLGTNNISQQVSTLTSGDGNKVYGKYGAAIGTDNEAGYAALAAGKGNKILAEHSIGLGQLNTILNRAWSAVALGFKNLITAKYGFAANYSNTVNATGATALGTGHIVNGVHQLVNGRYSISDTENKYAHIVGNGTDKERSNAYTLDWEGNAWFAGNLKIGSNNEDVATVKEIYRAKNELLEALADVVTVNVENSNAIECPKAIGIKNFRLDVGGNTSEFFEKTIPITCKVAETTDDLKAPEGNYYLEVTNRTHNIAHRFNYISQGISREVGRYYISVWVKTVTGNTQAQIMISRGGSYGNTVVEITNPWITINDKQWTRLQCEIDVSKPYNDSTITATGFHIGVQTTSPIDICIDNYHVCAHTDLNTNLLDGVYDYSFEDGKVAGVIGDTGYQGTGAIKTGGTFDCIPTATTVDIFMEPTDFEGGVCTLKQSDVAKLGVFPKHTTVYEIGAAVNPDTISVEFYKR